MVDISLNKQTYNCEPLKVGKHSMKITFVKQVAKIL